MLFDSLIEFIVSLCYGLGGISAWIIKGRKTYLLDELSDKHKARNYSIAVIMSAIIIGLFIYLRNRA